MTATPKNISTSIMTLFLAWTSATYAGENGQLYTQVGVSYSQADEYHSGRSSFASTVFDDLNGEYTFINYSVDLAYTLPSGFYIASGLYATKAEVKTNGLGLGVPDTDSNIEAREIPLALGFAANHQGIRYKTEARYTFNVDDDFDNEFSDAAARAVLLPVTDGSDYLTLSLQAATDLAGLQHRGTLSYRKYEEDVSHPVFPNFTLGDRGMFDYEIALQKNETRLYLGHLLVVSEKTKGTPSEVTATNYLYERPRYVEIRGGVQVVLHENFLVDLGLRYIYDGKDAPKEETAFASIVATF